MREKDTDDGPSTGSDSLSAIVYQAVHDAVAERLEDEIDLDDLLRDVVRAILEDRAEQAASKLLRASRRN